MSPLDRLKACLCAASTGDCEEKDNFFVFCMNRIHYTLIASLKKLAKNTLHFSNDSNYLNDTLALRVCIQYVCLRAIFSLYYDDPLTGVSRLIAAFMLSCGVSPVIGNGDYQCDAVWVPVYVCVGGGACEMYLSD